MMQEHKSVSTNIKDRLKNTTYPVFDENITQPGDLVMSMAGEVKHPALKYRSIGRYYIILGVIEFYTYVK